jgi:hypothetical protein
MTGPSKDWLIVRNRLRRRAGSQTNTSAVLESSWGAKARRMVSAALSSLVDHLPTWLILYTEEVHGYAQLAWSSTNGASAPRVIGQEYGSFHYPTTGVPTLRCVPYVYENEYGGMTLARLVNEEQRRHLCGGSRDILRQGSDIAWGGYTSAPGRWNGRFNDSTTAGTEACEVFPLGMIPPLQMPTLAQGNDLGATEVGPWKGSDAFFYSLIFENAAGEYSTYPIPRAPNSEWLTFPGFGYFQVDHDNPDHYFDGIVVTNIAVGPPGTVRKHFIRSTKVEIASDSNTPNFPAAGLLYFVDTIIESNDQTSFTLREGNDLSLDLSPIPVELRARQWPPRARCAGRFDGRFLLGDLRPNPYAMIVAPWFNGSVNAAIDSPDLYGSTAYFVAVTPTALVLRSVVDGVASDVTLSIAAKSLHDLLRTPGTDIAEGEHIIVEYWHLSAGQYRATVHVASEALARALCGIAVGMKVWHENDPDFTIIPRDTFVSSVVAVGGLPWAVQVTMSKPATLSAGGNATLVFTPLVPVTTALPLWGMGVVPGADADASASNLLRTLVEAEASFVNGDDHLTLTDPTFAQYITPGMLAYHDSFTTPPTVIAVDAVTGVLTVDHDAYADNTLTLSFAYDTGDYPLSVDRGYIRTFANSFPVVLPWSKAYLDRFEPDRQSLAFTVASPGLAQNALNSWSVKNRRTGHGDFGAFMEFADLGASALVAYEHGRMILRNLRTGLTHADEDYNLITVSWTRGSASPYVSCHGSGWGIFCDQRGFYVCGEGIGEAQISKAIYDPSSPEGSRGELEYAIGQCAIAAASRTDAYTLAAQVHAGVLRVRYFSGPDATCFDREIRYDFSANSGVIGPAEVLGSDGRPFPWSTPLTLSVACSAEVVDASGIQLYGALDTNLGTTDGRVDLLGVGTEDNGQAITPTGYTGLLWPEGLDDFQPTEIRVVAVKAGAGLTVGLTRDPKKSPEDAQWDDVAVPTSADNEYVRKQILLSGTASSVREALAARIMDDGSGPCPEVSLVLIGADVLPTAGK